MTKLIAALVAVMLGLVMLLGATVALLGGGGDELSPSQRASEEIPSDLLPLYRAAAASCEGMDWTLLAAVHKTETSFGRGSVTSSAGAQGPMQFMPLNRARFLGQSPNLISHAACVSFAAA